MLKTALCVVGKRSKLMYGNYFKCLKRRLLSLYNFLKCRLSSLSSRSYSKMDQVLQRVQNIKKSVEDKRDYRCLLLKNQLKVVLISDPTTDRSSASIDVHVGYSSDPENVPGLAHFCEHMLFMGTKKYPDENGYNKYLNEHGGYSNAFTSYDHTRYYFEIIPESLNEAVDRFAQFFVGPLFTECMTDRELNAVNSEHEKNILHDLWRFYGLIYHLADPKHPYHKFGTGNKVTLETNLKRTGISVRDELLKFHQKFYSANIMALAILGKENLDDLESLAVEKFSDINNKGISVPITNENPFKPENLPMITYVVPVKDVRALVIMFPIESMVQYYKSGPHRYIAHLIGHEGPGSLLSCLKKNSWCNKLSACGEIPEKGFNFLSIDVDLTEDGVYHVNDIIKLIFQYVNLIKNDEPNYELHKELAAIGEMEFRFKDKEKPVEYVQHLLSDIYDVPFDELLSKKFLMTEWNPQKIKEILACITPQNAIVFVTGKVFENKATLEAPWYGTKYYTERIRADVIKNWNNSELNEDLVLPKNNDFIPTCFDLLPIKNKDNQFPRIIYDNELSRVWFKQDDEFLLPKSLMKFDFVCPLSYLDPLTCNMTTLFVMLLKDSLDEFAYDATIAGLHYEIKSLNNRISLNIQGYNQKQRILLEKIIEKMVNFSFSNDRFEILKEVLLRKLKNFFSNQPYQLSQYYLSVLLAEKIWTKSERLEAMNDITADKLRKFLPDLLSRTYIESLMYGNLTEEQSLEIIKMVESYFKKSYELIPLLPTQLLPNREMKLPQGSCYLHRVINHKHNCSSVDLVYQCGMQSTESNMLLTLFTHIVQEPAFNVLRTTEQLGYIVASIHRKSNGVQSLNMLLQSEKDTVFVEERIEAFIETLEKTLTEMSDEDFQKNKDAVIALILEKPKQLGKAADRFWKEIFVQQYNFNRREIEANFLKTVQKSQIIKFFQNKIKNNAPERQKLAVHVVSAINEDGTEKEIGDSNAEYQNGKLITNIIKFKTEIGMYPIVQPYIDISRKGHKCKL